MHHDHCVQLIIEHIINLISVHQDVGVSKFFRSQVLELFILCIHHLDQLRLHMDEACHVTSIQMGTQHLRLWSSPEGSSRTPCRS